MDTSFVREDISDNTAAEQYYSDLQESLHITDLPIISVNTIEKKTYVLECSSRHFLVFDQYLMEVIRSINSFIMTDCPPDALKVFFIGSHPKNVIFKETLLQQLILALNI